MRRKSRRPRGATGSPRLKREGRRRLWPTLVGITSVLTVVAAVLVYVITRPSPVTGSLSLDSIPRGASIELVGNAMGQTPQVVHDLKLDSVWLTFRMEGYTHVDTFVMVRKGATQDVMIVLEPLVVLPSTGQIRVTSTPQNASVYIDGEPSGVTPRTLDSVLAGLRNVIVELEGHLPYERDVEVLASSTVYVHALLANRPLDTPTGNLRILPAPAATGRLEIDSDPRGAEVFVDGEPSGRTSITLEDVSSGSHNILLRMPGFRDREVSVAVAADETTQVTETLERQMGWVQVSVIPWAEIYVNAEKVLDEVSRAPKRLGLAADVSHRLDAYNPGLDVRCTRWVDVPADATIEVSIDLSISVQVPVVSIDDATDRAFRGAQIFVDGVPTDRTTPLPVEFIPGCSYEVTLVMEGYEPGRPTRVTVDEAGAQPVRIRMRKGG